MGRVNGVLMHHFDESDFKHPEIMDSGFLLFLDRVREYADFTFNLTSDGRTQAENDALKNSGSSPYSLHLVGRAVDVKWPTEKPWEEFARLATAVPKARDLFPTKMGFELEYVLDGHVHIGLFRDIRPDKIIIALT
jgi:hypothetical protein